MHIKNIYADQELEESRTYKKFLSVRKKGIYNCADNEKPFVGNRTATFEFACFGILGFRRVSSVRNESYDHEGLDRSS